jgi:nucleotide-binding universal stress UspA family protein
MKAIKRILATTDFSSLGNAAVERALLLAAREKAEVLVVHALPEQGPFTAVLGSGSDLHQRMRSAAQESLVELVQAGEKQVAEARTQVLEGAAADVVARAATGFQPDLIVMGAHARGTVKQFFLGGTASRILERAACPVLVIRQSVRADYARALAAVDLGPSSSRVVAHALMLARFGRTTVAHAYVAPFNAKLRYRGISNEDVERMMTNAAESAKARMAALLATPELSGANLETRIVTGHPNPVLFELASELEIDLIVAGRHKGTPIEETIMGSIARLLAYHAPCDVLVG